MQVRSIGNMTVGKVADDEALEFHHLSDLSRVREAPATDADFEEPDEPEDHHLGRIIDLSEERKKRKRSIRHPYHSKAYQGLSRYQQVLDAADLGGDKGTELDRSA